MGYAASGRWRRLLSLDEALLLLICRWQAPLLTLVMRALTRLGNAGSWVFMGLLLACAAPDRPTLVARLAAAAVVASLAVQLVKRALRRARPNRALMRSPQSVFVSLDENPDEFSFPSGHTASAFAVAVALAGDGTALGPLFLALASGIGFSRVYLGAHYPLDVAAGIAFGVLCGLGARVLVP